ncbi:hypothetical protein SAMN05519105_3604 [Rhodobacter sp. 24-YEA-8]|nr:hypothetical protein SAMN05519105_3604 [Rhodobacter sp. 24-YEA-8]
MAASLIAYAAALAIARRTGGAFRIPERLGACMVRAEKTMIDIATRPIWCLQGFGLRARTGVVRA